MYSSTYRKKYEEFLKHDFPRIPFVDDYETFNKLTELGKELVELHLMRKGLLTKVKFDVVGSNVVEKVKYGLAKSNTLMVYLRKSGISILAVIRF